jgi:hypothetical protein
MIAFGISLALLAVLGLGFAMGRASVIVPLRRAERERAIAKQARMDTIIQGSHDLGLTPPNPYLLGEDHDAKR